MFAMEVRTGMQSPQPLFAARLELSGAKGLAHRASCLDQQVEKRSEKKKKPVPLEPQ